MHCHPSLSLPAFLLALAAFAPNSSADVLTGRVVTTAGVGVPGVDIDAARLSGGGNPHLTNDGTDANGNFTATIDPGVYELAFYAPQPPATTLLPVVMSPVVVSGTVNLGNIVLQPGVSLSLRTLDASALPIAGVKLVVTRDDTGALVPMKGATTNAFGNLAVAVPATALTIDLDPSAIVTRTFVPQRRQETVLANTNLGNVTMLDGFVLSGSVTTTFGAAVNGVDLDVLDALTGVKLYTPGDRTAGLGTFSLRVPAGTYDVQFCPTFAQRLVAREFKSQVVSASVNFGAVPLSAGVALSGRVLDASGTPVPAVDLSVRLNSTGASILTCNDDTNALGNYAAIVPTGTLDVSFAFPGKHGTSAADLHTAVAVPSDTVLDGVLPAPHAAFDASPRTGAAALPVQFADLSSGAVTSWSWTFGDGASSTLSAPSHTYAANGTYTVSLTVNGPGGPHTHTEAGFIVVGNTPPVAEFVGTPTSGTAPLVVAFTNQSTGSITSHLWDFGDGASSTLASPSHTYTTAGSYSVTLTETGPGGVNTRARNAYIVVQPEPAPVADFSADVRRGKATLIVRFSNLSSGAITQRLWNFGDGTTSTAANPLHLYRQPGLYTVSLTVAGPGGVDVETKTGFVLVTATRSSSSAPTGSADRRLP